MKGKVRAGHAAIVDASGTLRTWTNCMTPASPLHDEPHAVRRGGEGRAGGRFRLLFPRRPRPLAAHHHPKEGKPQSRFPNPLAPPPLLVPPLPPRISPNSYFLDLRAVHRSNPPDALSLPRHQVKIHGRPPSFLNLVRGSSAWRYFLFFLGSLSPHSGYQNSIHVCCRCSLPFSLDPRTTVT